MDPRLQTLLNNSASITKLLPDDKLLAELWLNAQLFGIPSDWTTLNNVPKGFKFLSPDQKLNIEIYAIASKLGLPTDGAAIMNYVRQSVGYPSKEDSNLGFLIDNVWLKNIGAYPVIV